MLFNKPVSEGRFNTVWQKLIDWTPEVTNANELQARYGSGKWEQLPVLDIRGRSAKEVYAEMPEEMLAYIKSLPEYDDEIFRRITEDEGL